MGVGKPASFARVVGGPGTTKTTPVPSDERHGIAGTQTEHWSGRQDAKVICPQTTVNPNLEVRRG